MSQQQTFIERCLAGEAAIEEIDDFFDVWHADSDGGALHDFLGMTEEEYSLWLRAPDALPCILKARRDREPLTQAVGEVYRTLRLAPSGNGASSVERLRSWLREKGALA